MMNYIVSNNIKTTFLAIILLSGIMAIISHPPILSAVSAEIYQNAICDINHG